MMWLLDAPPTGNSQITLKAILRQFLGSVVCGPSIAGLAHKQDWDGAAEPGNSHGVIPRTVCHQIGVTQRLRKAKWCRICYTNDIPVWYPPWAQNCVFFCATDLCFEVSTVKSLDSFRAETRTGQLAGQVINKAIWCIPPSICYEIHHPPFIKSQCVHLILNPPTTSGHRSACWN